MGANDNKCTRYALTVEGVKKGADAKVAAETFKIKEVQNLYLNVEGSDRYYVQATLQSVRVHKCMGKHNSIEARIKIVQVEPDGKTTKKITFSQTQLQDVFKNKKVTLTIEKSDSKTFTVAENHYVYGVWPRFNKAEEVCYLDLGIYSWDVEMDNVKYSKCYTARRLGEYILTKMAESHGHKDDVKVNMNVLKHEYRKKDAKTGVETGEIEKIELTLPFLVQYNETEYEFMLRNANRCGEFFFFENGQLHLGLTTFAGADVWDYSSLESMSNCVKESDSTCYYNNAINRGTKTPGKHPYVGEYSNEDYYEPFSDMGYDSQADWMELNPPGWSRFFAAFFRMTGLVSLGLDAGKGELVTRNAAASYAKASYKDFNEKYFNGQENGTKIWQYAENSKYNKKDKAYKFVRVESIKDINIARGDRFAKEKDYRYAQFSEYYKDDYGEAIAGKIEKTERMDSVAFFEMRRLEEEIAKNQYVLTFDSCQKEILLGSVLSIPDIRKDRRYLVVEIVSETEETTVKTTVKTIVKNPDGTIAKKPDGTPDETIETKDEPKITDKMTVTVIPYNDSTYKGVKKTVPLPADVEPIRRVGPQTAIVTDSMDPKHLDRVRVKFGWESDDEDATPWISVNTPWATADGAGVAYKLDKGDEVMVDFEYGNAERPFVAGSRYNNDNQPPYGQRCFSTIIRSKNGHYMGFLDSSNAGTILTSLYPGLNIWKFIPAASDKFNSMTTEKGKTLKALGGIEISDAYGMYKISTSSGQRSINIESPYGTVNMSAAMGITISAPNGNVKIVGKNVDIVAGNNLTLKSGTNIDNWLVSYIGTGFFGKLKNMAKDGAIEVLDHFVTGMFDLPALRFIVELIVKPVAGTLKIHAGRYLMLEAGGCDASLPAGMCKVYQYKATNTIQKEVPNQSGAGNYLEDASDDVKKLNEEINRWISKVRAYKAAYSQTFFSICMMRREALNYIREVADANTNDATGVTGIVNDWLRSTATITTEIVKEKLKAKANNDDNNDNNNNNAWYNIVAKVVEEIRTRINDFKKNTWNPSIFYEPLENQWLGDANGMRLLDGLGSFDNTQAKICKNDDDSPKAVLRKRVVKMINDSKLFSKITGGDFGNDTVWSEVISKLSPLNQEGNDKVNIAHNYKWKLVNNVFPWHSVKNTYTWKPEAKGQILMSQNVGTTLSIDGQSIKASGGGGLEDIKGTMRNATID